MAIFNGENLQVLNKNQETILSSSSIIHFSTLVILLLIPFHVFFILAIVLFISVLYCSSLFLGLR